MAAHSALAQRHTRHTTHLCCWDVGTRPDFPAPEPDGMLMNALVLDARSRTLAVRAVKNSFEVNMVAREFRSEMLPHT